MSISIIDNTISFLSRALDMMSDRHKLLSSNIANQIPLTIRQRI